MGRQNKDLLNVFVFVVVLVFLPTMAEADSETLETALNAYYSGQPAQAVAILEPLARAGNVDAQVTLADILYSLSSSGHMQAVPDAMRWYEAAAASSSARANNALGVLYYNRWVNSRQKSDAELAISYYQKAGQLGAKIDQKSYNNLTNFSGVDLEKLSSQQETTAQVQTAETQAEVSSDLNEPVPPPIVESLVEPESVVTSETDKTEDEQDAQITEVDDRQEPVVEDSLSLPREQSIKRVTLEEIIRECGNYTQVGFGVYADMINGAQVIGTARVQKVDTGVLRLEVNRPGVSLRLSIKDVPTDITQDLQSGDKFDVTGIVVQSQLLGSSCSIHLQHNTALVE